MDIALLELRRETADVIHVMPALLLKQGRIASNAWLEDIQRMATAAVWSVHQEPFLPPMGLQNVMRVLLEHSLLEAVGNVSIAQLVRLRQVETSHAPTAKPVILH